MPDNDKLSIGHWAVLRCNRNSSGRYKCALSKKVDTLSGIEYEQIYVKAYDLHLKKGVIENIYINNERIQMSLNRTAKCFLYDWEEKPKDHIKSYNTEILECGGGKKIW